MVLLNGCDAEVEIDGRVVSLTTQHYAPDVLHPDGVRHLERFHPEPWPTWRWIVGDDLAVVHELFMPRENGSAGRVGTRIVSTWRLEGASQAAVLRVRPFLSGRDYHSMHHENGAFNFTPRGGDSDVEWHPYADIPGVRCRSNGRYSHQPNWYRQFLYSEELARGLDATEDLANPGVLEFDLAVGPAVCVFEPVMGVLRDRTPAADLAAAARTAECLRRRAFPSRLHFSADQYLVARGAGHTIVAGYPWFTDWGRDTFIALRGLCLATGRLAEARNILIEWAGGVSRGMLPNRFPDAGTEPEFNAVDASLWFVIAAHELLALSRPGGPVTSADRTRLEHAIDEILRGYAGGTRFGIRADNDGLLSAGVPGVQLTWMDAKVGDEVITPRIGKPVEIQALWLNALALAGERTPCWKALYERARPAFVARFWNEDRGCLYDVVDVGHAEGRVDAAMRPNQIFAIGGLPVALFDGHKARQIVDAVEQSLLAPAGLRSLAPGDRGYSDHYGGGPAARDRAYHQGTVWPWLMGAFVDAWIRVRGGSDAVRAEARTKFVEPFGAWAGQQGFGHVAEIADAAAPFTSRGCPFQAWSVGELLRMNTGSVTTS
jgi:predicted glycogen debranching enzyme